MQDESLADFCFNCKMQHIASTINNTNRGDKKLSFGGGNREALLPNSTPKTTINNASM